MNAILSAHKLRKSYGDQVVVDGLDLSIRRGECFGLLGPNGAGKTTTLRLMLGLIAPDSGELQLLDHTVPQQARAARMRVGVVPQMDNLDPDFTVAENLLVYGRYFGISDATINARMPELLEFANLTSKRDVKVPTLSGGMKRRLTLARALVNDPEVIFLDEPTTGLDPQARHLIWQRLRELTARGKTLLLTTHFMDEAERLCHRLAARTDRTEHRAAGGRGIWRAGYFMGAGSCGGSCAALRGQRRVCILLCDRCAAAAAGTATASGTALPAPARQSGGRVPETDRTGDARMISIHIHRNPGVGCGIRLLAVLFVLEKLLANPLSRKIRGKWLVMSASPQPCAALVLLRLCLEMGILRHRCAK
jgi:Nod factor-specific ABC transporter ATP-binding protein NodI